MLGPFLFTLYINDLADLQLSEGSKLVAYADDLLLYKPVESNADYNRVQEDVTTIDHWMSHNFLTLNATKCKHNHGNNKEQDTPVPPTLLGWSTAGMCAELQISWGQNHFQSILVSIYSPSATRVENLWVYSTASFT